MSSGDDRRARFYAHFYRQGAICRKMGSPFTASLCECLANNLSVHTPVGQSVLEWPGDADADALALRLAGALHGLVLDGTATELATIYPPCGDEVPASTRAWSIIERTLDACADRILHWLALPPQTNEVVRAAMIMPVIALVAHRFQRPVALYETGASAGLNLQLMQFRYCYNDVCAGDPVSPVCLRPQVRSSPPLFTRLPDVISRQGCDLNPLDPLSSTDSLRLRSYVWADQTERHERLSEAIQVYGSGPPIISRVDAAPWLKAELMKRPSDVLAVVYHTVVWQYLSSCTRDSILTTLREAGARATPESPLALVAMEGHGNPDCTSLSLTTWSGDAATDGQTRVLGHADYHGRWIDWTATGLAGSLFSQL